MRAAAVCDEGDLSLETVLPVYEPMPEPLRSDTPGTWAHDTMSRRVVEEILDAVVLKDCADDEWRPALLALREEILANAPLTPLDEKEEEDDVANLFGVQRYVMKAIIVDPYNTGPVALDPATATDFVWIAKDEIDQYFPPEEDRTVFLKYLL